MARAILCTTFDVDAACGCGVRAAHQAGAHDASGVCPSDACNTVSTTTSDRASVRAPDAGVAVVHKARQRRLAPQAVKLGGVPPQPPQQQHGQRHAHVLWTFTSPFGCHISTAHTTAMLHIPYRCLSVSAVHPTPAAAWPQKCDCTARQMQGPLCLSGRASDLTSQCQVSPVKAKQAMHLLPLPTSRTSMLTAPLLWHSHNSKNCLRSAVTWRRA